MQRSSRGLRRKKNQIIPTIKPNTMASRFRTWMQTTQGGLIFSFVVPGLGYAIIMQLFDMWDGKDFMIWKFLLRFIFFGIFGLVMREIQTPKMKKTEEGK